jgi:heat shock protein HslJ
MRTTVLSAVLATIVAVTAGCASGQPSDLTRVGHPAQLAGTSWRLVELNGRATAATPEVTLTFTVARFGGTAPCNGFGGSYAYDAATGALHLGELISTKRACAIGPDNELEAVYLDGLRKVADADMDPSGRLVLVGPDTRMAFEVAGEPAVPAPSVADAGPS